MIALQHSNSDFLRRKLYVFIYFGQALGSPPHRSRPGLVAEKGNRRELSQSMRLLHGVGGWEKLNTRGAMQIIIRGDLKCQCEAGREVRSAKCEMRIANATTTTTVNATATATANENSNANANETQMQMRMRCLPVSVSHLPLYSSSSPATAYL